MNMSKQEKSLKDLMEDMGPGSQLKQTRAELTLRLLGKQFEGISYDEAMTLYEENEQVLLHTPWTDPAHEYLMTMRTKLLQLATALNDVRILGRHDHELPVHALVSIGDTSVECNFYIPKLQYAPVFHNKHVLSTIRQKAAASSEWSSGLRFNTPVDFVEL